MPKSKKPIASAKQKKATELVLKGQSVSSAMREAGYTEASAKNPKNLTETRYFLDIMEKHGVTDEKIAKVMSEGLEAKHKGEVDHGMRHKYLETALKVKKLTEDKPNTSLMGMVIVLDGDEPEDNQT